MKRERLGGGAARRSDRQRSRRMLALAVAVVMSAALGSARVYAIEGENEDKAGRVMLNARGGVVVGIANADRDRLLGMAGIDFGVALDDRYNAYLVLTPQLDVRQDFYNVMVPLGFQYDIRIARGLYIYPRVSLGYSAMISNAAFDIGSLHLSASQVIHGGVGIPELGLKAVLGGHFNLGIEPVSFPIFFTDRDYAVWYRANIFLGGTF